MGCRWASVGETVSGEGIIIEVIRPLVVAFVLFVLAAGGICAASAGYASGVWDNFNYDPPASYWASAARQYEGSGNVLDLVVAQAQDGAVALPFPFTGTGLIRSASESDLAEPYLDTFDSEGLGVILSLQPSGADVKDLIDIVLNRYGHHKCLIGINVDMEWKQAGVPQHVSSAERDAWVAEIGRLSPGLKLFLTYYQDYTYFPPDDGNTIVLYDGSGDTQDHLLAEYGELAKHFANVGIYTGYPSSRPAAASDSEILKAASNTRYILHAGDSRSDPGASASTIGWPSGGLKSTGLDMTGLKNKMSMPSMGSSLSGFPAIGLSAPAVAGGTVNNDNLFQKTAGSSANDVPERNSNAGSAWSPFSAGFVTAPTFGAIALPGIEFFRPP